MTQTIIPSGLILFLLALLYPVDAQGESRPEILTGPELMKRYYEAFYAPEKDCRIEVRLDLVNEQGHKTTRRFTMWRVDLDPEGRYQKVVMYFHEPANLRGLTIMVWKYPDRDDDRWTYIPALDLVRQMSARDCIQSFVGSDYTYEDVISRDEFDTFTYLGEEEQAGIPCYLVEITPGSKASWSRILLWMDKKTFLPVQAEYYNLQNQLERVYTSGLVRPITVPGENRTVPTIIERKMQNVISGHHTLITFESVNYNVDLDEKDFSERHLRRLPKRWIR